MSRQERISPCFTADGKPKAAFPNRDAAQAAATSIGVRNGDWRQMTAYECPICGSWHTGHQKTWRWRKTWRTWPKRRERRRDEIGDGWE